ncbi:MAG: hypothetical protein ACRDT6_19810 [Micromonosporaceae bacterium]
MLHEPTGEWVGYGEREQRQRRADLWRLVHASETAVHACLQQARELAPAGWRVDATQAAAGAWPFYLRLTPPPGSPDVTASLHPPITGDGWYVQVSDRVDRVGYPLYTAGVRAASYPELPDAIAAAVNAVRVACGAHQPDQPPPATNTGEQPS